MTSFRAALLAALCSIFLASCGDTFRPIAIPVTGTLPPAQASKTAQVITADGTATNYNLSGGTVTGQAPVGQNPSAALLIGNRVYVANQSAATLSVYNALSPQNPVPGTITLDPSTAPVALATTFGSTVYVAYSATDSVGIVNASTNTANGAIALNANGFNGTSPQVMIGNNAGTRLFVGNAGSNNISVIDLASNAVIATLGAGICTNPVAMARTPDTSYIYVACQGSNNILIINTDSNAVDYNIAVGAGPNSLAFDAANKRLIVTNGADNSVSVLNENFTQPVSLQHSMSTVPISLSPVAATPLPDGSRIYVATTSGNVVVINSSTLMVKTNIPVPGIGQQIAASTDSTRVAVTTVSPNALQVIDTSTESVVTTQPLVGLPRVLLVF